MRTLSEILHNVKYSLIKGDININVEGLAFDSRKIDKNYIFVAISGTEADGHKFIHQAIKQGAKIVVCEQLVDFGDNDVTIIQVENTRLALSALSANWYNNPSETMKVIGITGTNGKTTTATMLYNVFEDLGFVCGLFSTVKILVHGKEIPATHTTPDPITIHRTMGMMRDAGCEYCFMEVSSHAIVQDRVAHIHYSAGVFTNITQDHLDYHQTFSDYIAAKQSFFNLLPNDAIAFYNSDDKNGNIMVQNTKAEKLSFAVKTHADYKAKIIEKQFGGMLLELNDAELWTPLTGQFNAYNLTAVYAVASNFHQNGQEVLASISKQGPVRGRFEQIKSESGVNAIVDYAHTPDAVINVLSTIQEIRTGNEKLIVLIGAGGNRDKTKRPRMAKAACEYADLVIFTSDNPRNENPASIIKDMKDGVPATFTGREITIESREEAIKTACVMAGKDDIILVAGKGHETYQEVNGKKTHFDDREMLLKYLK